jgi:hypothetical protein
LYNYYKCYSKIDYEIIHRINKDIKRTSIGNQDFKIDYKSGQNQLFNVLVAYANYDPEINYCQGIAFIVAILLYNLEDEEDSFYALVYIMQNLKWRYCFDKGTSKISEFI